MLSSDELKLKANKLFQERNYDAAIDLYTQAINLHSDPVFYSNRALAYIRTEAFQLALDDACKAIELQPTLTKAYFRRATAYMVLKS